MEKIKRDFSSKSYLRPAPGVFDVINTLFPLTPQERIKLADLLEPEELVKRLKPEERVRGLKPEELAGLLKPKEREELLKYLMKNP